MREADKLLTTMVINKLNMCENKYIFSENRIYLFNKITSMLVQVIQLAK